MFAKRYCRVEISMAMVVYPNRLRQPTHFNFTIDGHEMLRKLSTFWKNEI